MTFWDLKQPAKHPAIIDDAGNHFAYLQLAESVNRVCNCLPQAATKLLGFILCQNQMGPLIGYLAGLQRGDTICLLDAKIDRKLIDGLIAVYQPDWILTADNHIADFGCQRTKLANCIIHDCSPARLDFPPIHPSLAVLLPTSGSTGNPKMVRLSHRNLQANALSISEYLRLDASERPITTLPMNYSYGLSVINSHLSCGATLLLTNHSIMTSSFWSFLKEAGATSIAGVPYTYHMLRRLGMDKMSLPSLRILTQAGGRLEPTLVEYFQKLANVRNWRFFVMYGATEATARMSYLPPEKALAKPHSIGIPVPGGEFEIAASGELLYRGPNVMMGYAESRTDLSRGDELNGVLQTGDLAEVDSDGFFYIVGRMRRFLKLFGLRINLDDLERLIESNSQSPTACTGKDDQLAVFVENESAAEIAKRTLSQTYHLHHTVYRVHIVSEIARTSNGKIAYNQLIERMS